MLTQIDVYGSQESALELPLTGGLSGMGPVQIRNIIGLGPVRASINTTPYSSVDGESYSGNSVGKRNIVLTVGLNPNWVDQTMESLRQMLYAYFMSKQRVLLQFFSDHLPTCQIEGYVESCEPSIFSKDPEMQISVICPKPDFIAVEPTVVDGITIWAAGTKTEVAYIGTVPTGFMLKVEASVSQPEYTGEILVIRQDPGYEPLTIVTTIDNEYFFVMSTLRGDKYVRSQEVGGPAQTNLMGTLVVGSVWAQLLPGVNEFAVMVDMPDVGQTWELTYFNRFGGL